VEALLQYARTSTPAGQSSLRRSRELPPDLDARGKRPCLESGIQHSPVATAEVNKPLIATQVRER